MNDETQTPGTGPQGTGQENSMGGASEWSTVPSPQPPSTPQSPAPPAQSLEPLPPVPPAAAPPQPTAGGYQQVYGTGSGPGAQMPPPPQGPPQGYGGGPGPQYPPPPPPPSAGQGLSSYAAAAISYITFIPAVIFLVMEPYNRDRFVRFHAWQSIALWIVWFAVKILFRVFALAGLHFILFGIWTLIFLIIGMILFIFGLIALIKASQGQWYKIPIVGDLAVSLSGGQK